MRRTLSIALLATLAVSANAQLTLPYSGTDPTATLSSFQITKSGTAGRANTLYISNASNTSDVLLVNTVGLGRAAYFTITNAANNQIALRADSNGTGIGVFGFMTGSGKAGMFRITNASNTNSALHALTNGAGAALRAQAGTGLAGDFEGAVRITKAGTALQVMGDSGFGGTAFAPTHLVDIRGDDATRQSLFHVVNGEEMPIPGRARASYFVSKGPGERTGVLAQAYSESSKTYALKGEATSAGSDETFGVYGTATTLEGAGSSNFGVYGKASGGAGVNVGVYGTTTGGLYPYAGFFNGDLYANSASAGVKNFLIDHPQDPANKFLEHSSVESDERMNLYRGVVVTDARGYARIAVPGWFSSLNKDYQYQLTVVDTRDSDDFVLAKVVQELDGQQFRIRTSAPRVKVNWLVTGVRHDPTSDYMPLQVEREKTGSQKGKYLIPEAYGKDRSYAIANPEANAPGSNRQPPR